jgi:hypothetical protein
MLFVGGGQRATGEVYWDPVHGCPQAVARRFLGVAGVGQKREEVQVEGAAVADEEAVGGLRDARKKARCGSPLRTDEPGSTRI